MRVVAAILAMVMSVTTGGPLRCPCQVLTLLKGDSPSTSSLPTPDDDDCCSCKSHLKKHENKSPDPEKKLPPCQHGPEIDLPPPSNADSLVEGHDLAVAGDLNCESLIPSNAPFRDASRVASRNHHAPPLQVLKYCFAFRCEFAPSHLLSFTGIPLLNLRVRSADW